MQKIRITIPDYITLSRFVAMPIIFALIMAKHTNIAFLVYAAAALTDTFDGKVARLLNQKTRFGGMLDALADRCLCAPIVLALLIKDIIPVWALVILICYAVMEAPLGAWITLKYRKFYLYFVHRNSIRYFAVILFAVIGGYVLNWGISLSIANILLIISIPFAVYTYVDYTRYIATHKRWV